MAIDKKTVVPLIALVVFIVLFMPVIYLRYINLFGALTYFVFYVAFGLVLQHVMRKSGFKLPDMRSINTLTTEGRIKIMVASGFFFAGIIIVITRALVGLPQTYVWVLFASLFVVGAIIGDVIRKVSQKN